MPLSEMPLSEMPQSGMPELPETETIARDLDAEVRGAVVSQVEVQRADVLREATAAEFIASVTHATITRVWRRAKLVVIDLLTRGGVAQEGARNERVQHLVVQPRFTGGLLIAGEPLAATDAAYVCMSCTLADGRHLHYKDVRRLGTVALMTAERFEAYQSALGPEPLDARLTDPMFSGLIRASKQPVKVALMDQKRLAGVGNIYANEALWHAGIDPSREARSLSDTEATTLLLKLREVLTASIAARGTSFRDYRDARGERGRFVEQLVAYGRAGLACVRCERRLVGTHAIDGRGTVFCATCQR